MTIKNIRPRVLAHVVANPNSSAAQIGQALELTDNQTRGALAGLRRGRKVASSGKCGSMTWGPRVFRPVVLATAWAAA